MADKKSSTETISKNEPVNTLPREAAKDTAPPLKLEATVRPITPVGNLLGFASVKFNDAFVITDFKVLQGEKGMFVGMPSKPDKTSKTGYRDTAKPITANFHAELTGVVVEAYHKAVEQLQTRAAALAVSEKPSIQKQLAEGAKQAAKDNAARPASEKSGKAQEPER